MQVGSNVGDDAQQPLPIGGWLYLVAAGLCISPVAYTAVLWMATPGLAVAAQSNGTHWALLWIERVLMVALLVVTPLLLLLPFFRRSRRFPDLFIAWHVVAIGAAFVDVVVTFMVLTGAPTPTWGEVFTDRLSAQFMSTQVTGAAIWVAYISYARRVKRTFIR